MVRLLQRMSDAADDKNNQVDEIIGINVVRLRSLTQAVRRLGNKAPIYLGLLIHCNALGQQQIFWLQPQTQKKLICDILMHNVGSVGE